MHPILSTAIDAAKTAGQIISAAANDIGALNIEQKSLHDYVSEIDRNSERAIVDHIGQEFPEHAVLGEEFGTAGVVESDYQWIIDPLDGTTNFLRGIPHYAVSIGVMRQSHIEHAVVFDPAKEELFTASRGEGAQLNGKPIAVSSIPSLRGALIATGVPFSGENLAELDSFSQTMHAVLAKHTSGIRRLGSAALDLAYVAAGRYDGYWEARLQTWDIAAGALIVQEAGGQVSDFHGEDGFLRSGDIVASNSAIIEEFCDITAQAYRRYPHRPW